MASKKNLNLTNLKNEAKKIEKQFTVDVDGYSLKIDETFRPSKLNALVLEVLDVFDKTVNTNLSVLEYFTPYIMLLTIKHFTSLQVPDDFEEQLELMNILIDLGYFDKIISHFPDKELDKLSERIEEMTSRLNKNIDQLQEEMGNLDVESEEVKDLIGKDD